MNEFLELQYNIESCKLESKMLYDVDSYMFNTYKMALYEGGGYDDEVIDLLYEKAVSDHIEKKKGILRRMIDAIRTFITKFVTRKQIEEVKNIDTHEIDRSAMINSIPPQEIEKAFNDIHREYAKLWNESKNGKSISDEELEKLLNAYDRKIQLYKEQIKMMKKGTKMDKVIKGVSFVSFVASVTVIISKFDKIKDTIKRQFDPDRIGMKSSEQSSSFQKILSYVSKLFSHHAKNIQKSVSDIYRYKNSYKEKNKQDDKEILWQNNIEMTYDYASVKKSPHVTGVKVNDRVSKNLKQYRGKFNQDYLNIRTIK